MLEALILGIEYKRISLEENFRDESRDILEDAEADDLVDWPLKVLNYLNKQKKIEYKPENVLNVPNVMFFYFIRVTRKLSTEKVFIK